MKLSKYPVGTVIDILGEGGKFVKEEVNWQRVGVSPYFLTFKQVNKIQKNTPHRIQFISAPWGVVVELVQMLQEEYGYTDAEGKPITFKTIYKDAMQRNEEHRQRILDRESRAQAYLKIDVEVTEALYHASRPETYVRFKGDIGEKPKVEIRNCEWRSIPEVPDYEVNRDGDILYKGRREYDNRGVVTDVNGDYMTVQMFIHKAFPDIPMRVTPTQ